jgi:hypothetical protein
MIASKTETIQNTASNRHHFIDDDFHTLDPVLLQKSFLKSISGLRPSRREKKVSRKF